MLLALFLPLPDWVLLSDGLRATLPPAAAVVLTRALAVPAVPLAAPAVTVVAAGDLVGLRDVAVGVRR